MPTHSLEQIGRFQPSHLGIVAGGAFGLAVIAQSLPAEALTSVQNFTTTDTLSAFTALATETSYSPPTPRFTVQPFKAYLGKLNSVTVTWATSSNFTGVVGNADTGGLGEQSFFGPVAISDKVYNGYNNAKGDGGPPASTISYSVGPTGNTTTFLPADAGVTYDSLILASFIGASAYPISYTSGSSASPLLLRYRNISSGTSTFTTTAEVTYNYTPVPAPLPLFGAGAAWGVSRRLRRRCGKVG